MNELVTMLNLGLGLAALAGITVLIHKVLRFM